MPAVLFLTGLERKLVMHKDSSLHHPEGRETRGRGRGRKEGGRDRGKGKRPVNNPPRTLGRSYTHAHTHTHTHTHTAHMHEGEMEERSMTLEPGGLGQFPSSNIAGCVSVK